METEYTNLSLEHVLGILARRAPWIVLCVVVAAGATYVFSKQQTKKYTATATLVFQTNELGQQLAGLQGAGGNESEQAQENTNLKLVQLGDVAARTAQALGHGVSAQQVSGALSVSFRALTERRL